MIFSALGGAYGVYFYLKISEEDEFKHTFHENAELILRAIRKNFALTLGAVDAMAFNMVSSARSSGEDWPFVTIPDFGVRAAKVLALSEVAVLAVHPLVSDEEREQWENYTASNNNWVSLVHRFVDGCLNCFSISSSCFTSRFKKELNFRRETMFFRCMPSTISKNGRRSTPSTSSRRIILRLRGRIKLVSHRSCIHHASAFSISVKFNLSVYLGAGFYLPMWQSAPVVNTDTTYNG
jgi:hypothetical protein